MDRLELQYKLEELLGSKEVYFQAPSTTQISYPCVIYSPESPVTRTANNRNYIWLNRYEIKVITRDIETELPRKIIEEFGRCSAPRYYQSDNLHHFSITLEC